MYQFIKKCRSALLVFLTHQLALPFLQKFRKPEFFPFTTADLFQFKPETLGYDLVHFLHRKELSLLPYYAKHDIKHILLDYDTTEEGEVCLQCFMLGNGHCSFPVTATVLFGLLLMPEHYAFFITAFKRGRKSIPIHGWQWHLLVHEKTTCLKNIINHT